MAASPPLVTSDILNPEASPSPRINETQTREGIASVISTIRAQIADQPAGAMGPVSQPPAMASAVTGSTPPVPVLGASSQKAVPSTLAPSTASATTTNASNGAYSAAVPNRNHQALVSPPLSGPGQSGQQPFGPIAPKTAQSAEKTKAYERLMDMVQNTDASVVRQVVRENWHKCLVGTDYHCGFIVSLRALFSTHQLSCHFFLLPTSFDATRYLLGDIISLSLSFFLSFSLLLAFVLLRFHTCTYRIPSIRFSLSSSQSLTTMGEPQSNYISRRMPQSTTPVLQS